MSGAGIEIRIDGLAPLQRFADRLAGVDVAPLLDGVTGVLERQTRRRIKSEKTDPDGDAWDALDPAYAARKSEKSSGGILEFGGMLLRSIDSSRSGNTATTGSNELYAATHQYGDDSRGMPRRTFIGLSADNARELEDEIDDWIMGVLDA